MTPPHRVPSLTVYIHTEPPNAMPRTVNRLFVTSLVLMGITAAFSVSDPHITFLVFGVVPMAIMLGMFINHLVLWHLAKKEVAACSMLVEDPAKGRKLDSTSRASSRTMVSTTPVGAYPMCLISLPNIIWTFFAALFMLCFMWMPIWSVTVTLCFNGWNYGNRWNMLATSLMQGILVYAECGVLFALFGIYVRERKRFLRGKVQMPESKMETKV